MKKYTGFIVKAMSVALAVSYSWSPATASAVEDEGLPFSFGKEKLSKSLKFNRLAKHVYKQSEKEIQRYDRDGNLETVLAIHWEITGDQVDTGERVSVTKKHPFIPALRKLVTKAPKDTHTYGIKRNKDTNEWTWAPIRKAEPFAFLWKAAEEVDTDGFVYTPSYITKGVKRFAEIKAALEGDKRFPVPVTKKDTPLLMELSEQLEAQPSERSSWFGKAPAKESITVTDIAKVVFSKEREMWAAKLNARFALKQLNRMNQYTHEVAGPLTLVTGVINSFGRYEWYRATDAEVFARILKVFTPYTITSEEVNPEDEDDTSRTTTPISYVGDISQSVAFAPRHAADVREAFEAEDGFFAELIEKQKIVTHKDGPLSKEQILFAHKQQTSLQEFDGYDIHTKALEAIQEALNTYYLEHKKLDTLLSLMDRQGYWKYMLVPEEKVIVEHVEDKSSSSSSSSSSSLPSEIQS